MFKKKIPIPMTDLHQKLDDIISHYENESYIIDKISNYIHCSLPHLLEVDKQAHERRLKMISEQESFIDVFVTRQNFFYLGSNDTFYQYNGENYVPFSEECIHHQILTQISETLTTISAWKYKTKQQIIKKIKERHLFKSIPESKTIQNVLTHFYPVMFETKEELKYFLILIGDCLMKKYSDEAVASLSYPIVLLTSQFTKPKSFVNIIERAIYFSCNISNAMSAFVTKYHEKYNYDNCRLLHLKNILCDTDKWFHNHTIEFVTVCCYYSERYVNSEAYLISDEILSSKVLYLQNKTNKDILTHFICTCFETTNVGTPFITWKDVHYLWKLYTKQMNKLPSNIIYGNTLKELLKQVYFYDERKDSFNNLSSKLIPRVSSFLEFWETNIVCDETSELEIEELSCLYKQFANQTITETSVVDILSHYFPAIEILECKYIYGFACKFWNKTKDIIEHIQAFHSYHKCIDTLYSSYIKQKHKIHASKTFFKKVIEENCSCAYNLSI